MVTLRYQAGDFRTPIGIFTQSTAENSDGDLVESFAEAADSPVFALLEDVSGGENDQADRTETQRTVKITFLFFPTLKAQDQLRMVDEVRTFKILNIATVNNLRAIHVVTCAETPRTDVA